MAGVKTQHRRKTISYRNDLAYRPRCVRFFDQTIGVLNNNRFVVTLDEKPLLWARHSITQISYAPTHVVQVINLRTRQVPLLYSAH